MRQPFEQLEKEFGDWIENENTVAVSSGTSALHLACQVVRSWYELVIPDQMIVPEFTMIACPRAAVMAGFTPVFRDCHDNLLVKQEDPQGIPLMAVHVYGRKDDVTRYHESQDLVIEDLAEGHGIAPHPKSFAACWSFYQNKIVYGCEGGMIAFEDKEHADLARKLRSLGFTSEHNYTHVPRGINARMSNLHAEPILRSLRDVKTNLQIRRDMSTRYDVELPTEWQMPPRDVHWVHDIRIPGLSGTLQDFIVKECRSRGLEARHAFKPMSDQPEFYSNKPELNARTLSREVIYLPLSEKMDYSDVTANARIFTNVCRSFGVHPN